ncbi:response regulator [Asticcacaulis taihuensis]|jgi:CheY-like chemotaxis protein|uniref:response regulator n=1 Tax=Asticcacaulis taihuensis TaxID=260084 RepID=UPI0026F3389C|nr:response regulator [Asticcacaulis taihuensis]
MSENSTLRVLVVDDNQASADTLHWTVELFGDTVKSCHDGKTALKLAADFRPDVVLLDIGMPGMDGLQVCEALRAMPDLKHVKIIAQTGWGDEQMRRKTATAGFDLHLVKPVDPHVLEDMLWLLRSGRKAA